MWAISTNGIDSGGKMYGKKQFTILASVFAGIIVCLSAVIACLLVDRKAVPDYNPIEPDKNLETIMGDDPIELKPQSENGGAVSISYGKEMHIDLSDGVARLYFANPKRSMQSVVLTLDIHGVEVARSGAIPPGSRLEVLKLNDAAKYLSQGEYECKLKLSYYDKDTAELSVVTTDLHVTAIVNE